MQKVVSSSAFNDLTSLHRGLCWSVCGCVGLCLDERARFGFSSALSSFIGQHRSGGIAWNLNPLISINNKQRDGRTKEIQSRADSPIHTVNFRPKNQRINETDQLPRLPHQLLITSSCGISQAIIRGKICGDLLFSLAFPSLFKFPVLLRYLLSKFLSAVLFSTILFFSFRLQSLFV